MKKILKWFTAAVIFCGLTVGFSALLLDLPVEILLYYRTDRPVKLKLHPSLFMDRNIDKKTFSEAELHPVSSDKNAVCKVRIPLSRLRKVRLDVPPGSDFELSGIGCRIPGIWQEDMEEQKFFYTRGSDELELSPILAPETAVPASLVFHTGQLSGHCEFRLVNDMPRFLALLAAALLAALPACLFLSLFNATARQVLKKYLYLSIFLILLFGGLAAEIFSDSGDSGCPKLDLPGIASYPEKFTGWYQQNLPFRNVFFSLYYRICSGLGISPVGKVFSGQDGWLFIGHFDKQTPYEDYLGINLFTEEQLQTISRRLEQAQEQLKKKNIRFVLFIAPGKMHVYGDKLKTSYQRPDPDGPTRTKQLVEYLRAHCSVPVEHPLDELQAARKQLKVPLYYQRDTHWNFCGAYIGARAMMRLIDPAAAKRMPDISRMEINSEDTFYGDLARMTEAPKTCREPDWKIRDPDSFYEFFPGEAGCYRLDCRRSNGPKVFFIRDSFLTHAMPHLAGQLSRATCYWSYSLNMKMIEKDSPDVVVLEIVDRNLMALLYFHESTVPMRRGGRLL